ncbi:MAG: two-component system sensor histidine kinase CreC [Thermomonas sp.]
MRIGLRVLLGYFLIVALAALLVGKVFVEQVKPGVRQAMEGTLIDSANTLAELAGDDMLAGRIADGRFAQRVRAVRNREVGADVWGFAKDRSGFRITVTDARGIVVFDSEGRDLGRDNSRWNDVYLTLRGKYGARSTRDDPADPDSTIMHVAAPIRDDGGRIVGVLTVAKPNRAMAPFIARSQLIIARWGFVLMGTALLVGLVAAWWLSRQLGALRRYADAVAAGERVQQPRAAGEFGDLGRALHDMREKLEGKQYVEQYVHALTHELKSPLAAIRGATELLEQPLPEADRARFVASIAAQGERMAQMVDNLLALAAVEHRQRLETRERIDLFSLANEVAAQCNAGEDRVVVGGSESIVEGDPFLLRQAIANLVENAVSFSPRDCKVDVDVSQDDGKCFVRVIDRGPGIPGYALPRVFERFYSLSRPDGGSRSSGLGLPFVAQVAELHGGRATLENATAGGAIATLSLPAA